MFNILADTLDSAYIDIAKVLLDQQPIVRKNIRMFESQGTLVLTNPRTRVIQNSARKISPGFLAGEFFWIFFGMNDVNTITKFNRRMSDFSDDQKVLYGAYGIRLQDQLVGIIRKLKKDKYSRQAVAVIGKSEDLNIETKDFPCNIALHFIVEAKDRLSLNVFVRSQDLFLGFPYDVFHWTMLQEALAKRLALQLGEYRHFMSNCHIYEQDIEKFRQIIKEKNFASDSMLEMLNSPWSQYNAICHAFQNIDNPKLEILDDIDDYWKNLLTLCENKVRNQYIAGTDLSLNRIGLNWIKH